ncbi:MAG: 1-deoxy-D-xylulose-5-phosphate reductoisomerase [Candidatus Omnitrophica bacterium]|nr:1-deoxy-D-xylulose-5-phosphate reductoisomerase [Candidatus Omnitrophota bacterium]
MRRIAVLGSTGSIGKSALDVIAGNPQTLSLVGIAARSRVELLEEQVARYQPRYVSVLDEERALTLRQRVGTVTIFEGTEGLIRLATHPDVDMVLFATAGPDALVPLIRAIEAGKRIALASKELLVMAGEYVMELVAKHQTSVVPVDSEHAALFQALQGVRPEEVERIVLTGSGGPLWAHKGPLEEGISRAQVLNHPKWRMGPKITVDSATLMNKGLEVIEAQWLFGMPLERIGVVIHPQAIIHGIVELCDGGCLAHLGVCDMRLPIQYALSYPERWATRLPRLSWSRLAELRFFEPDSARFPCFRLALEAARSGGTACAVLSAANEVAVAAFLREELAFGDIPRIIEEILTQHTPIGHPRLEEILGADAWARQIANNMVAQCSSLRPSRF